MITFWTWILKLFSPTSFQQLLSFQVQIRFGLVKLEKEVISFEQFTVSKHHVSDRNQSDRGKSSDSSERLALMNTLEEMGQARDTSTHVTFNALNSTSSPRILDSLLCCSLDAREEKKNLHTFSWEQNFATKLSRSWEDLVRRRSG